MSVPKSERGQSSLEYLKQLRLFEKDIITLCEKKPKKYLFFLREFIEKPAANAYRNAKAGSAIYVVSKADAELKRKFMYAAYCDIMAVSSQIELFFDMYKTDGLTINQIEDLSKKMHYCSKLLKETLALDKERADRILAKEKEE